jgi:hypothetical protein
MRKTRVPILCFGLAGALLLLGAMAAFLGRADLLLTSFAPARVLALIGFILRNFVD